MWHCDIGHLYLLQQLIQAKMECKQFENELKAVKQSQLEEKKAEKSSEGLEDKVILNKSVLLGNSGSWIKLLRNLVSLRNNSHKPPSLSQNQWC